MTHYAVAEDRTGALRLMRVTHGQPSTIHSPVTGRDVHVSFSTEWLDETFSHMRAASARLADLNGAAR